MYGPLWRALPGPWPVKLVQLVVLVLAVVAVCFLWVFPAVAPHMPFNGNTVDDRGSVSSSAPLGAPRPLDQPDRSDEP